MVKNYFNEINNNALSRGINLRLGWFSGLILLLFSFAAIAQPYIRTDSGIGRFGYIEKDTNSEHFALGSGGYGNIYNYGVRSYINGSTNVHTYMSNSPSGCTRGNENTTNFSFGSVNTGSEIFSSVFVEYCGPVYSHGNMTPTSACFNEKSFFVLDVIGKTDELVATASYSSANSNVVLTFLIDNGNTAGQSLNRLWVKNNGTAQEGTDILNDAFAVYYEEATGSEVFNGNESFKVLEGNHGGNGTTNEEFGHDSLGISIPQNATGGLRCYVVLRGTSTYLNASAKGKNIRMEILSDGISLLPARSSQTTVKMNSLEPSATDILIPVATAPVLAATTAASSITGSSATSGGNVTSDGGATITERGIVYSTTTDPEVTDNKVVASGTTGSFVSNLTGLDGVTTYYVRAFATNSEGTTYGTEVDFTTLGSVPVVGVTTAASNISGTTAASGGAITSNGGAAITERGIVYSTTTEPEITDNKVVTAGTTGSYTSGLTSLTPGTQYFVRCFATNSNGTSYGTETTFEVTLPPTGFTATAQTPTSISFSFTNWDGDKAGADHTYDVMLVRNTTGSFTAPTQGTSYSQGGSIGSDYIVYKGSGTAPIDGSLISDTTYHYAIYSEQGDYYSAAATDSAALVAIAPTISATVAMDQIDGTTARSLSNTITDDGGAAVSGRGLVYGTTTTPTLSNSVKPEGGSGTGSFTTTLTGLTPGTKYFVRAYATNSADTSYGAEVTFTALDAPSGFTATSASPTSIDLAWTKFSGDLNGVNTTYDVIVVRSTDASIGVPVNGTAYTDASTISGDQVIYAGSASAFTDTGLTTSTTYYYGIYSQGSDYYSPVASVNEAPDPDIMTFNAALIDSNIIAATSASISSNITDDGGATIIQRGVVYGTSSNPEIGSATKLQDGVGDGAYTTLLLSLLPDTQYYVRSYAISAAGTGYSDQVTFKTLAPPTAFTATGVSSSQIDLAWTNWIGDRNGSNITYDVLVVRSTDATFTAPTNTSTYTDASTIGGDQVIYVGNASSFSDTGLSLSTQYYYAIYSEGYTYYSVKSTADDTTLAASPPTVSSTSNASSITKNSASSGGNVSSDNGAAITDRGVIFSTNSTPTLSNGVKVSEGGTTTGSFSANTGTILSGSTTYYFRAYATNSVGTSYGPVSSSFSTSAHSSRNQILSDRIYFKNAGNADEKYYCAYNESDCYGESLGTEGWNGKNLGTYVVGTTAKLGAYAMTAKKSNGNACYFNYRIYKEGDTPGSFTSQNMNYKGECNEDNITDDHGNNVDKAWRWDLSSVSIPTSPGTYVIECYFNRDPDYLNNDGNNYKAFLTVEIPDGIFSGRVSLKKNTDAEVWYQANTETTCDPTGSTEDVSGLDIDMVGSDAYYIGGRVISTKVLTDPKLHYVMYPVGGRPETPTFSEIDITTASTTCGNFQYQLGATTILFSSNTYTSGQWVLETYFSGVNGVTTYEHRQDGQDNFITTFSINEPNDGNIDPTGTNISGIYESYIGQLILGYDANGDPDPSQRVISKVYDLDGNYASSNSLNFDLGTTPPGISFRVGMEAKVFTKGTHKACGCSSWYYLYEEGVDTDPVEPDFPLPDAASTTVLYSQQWGKFTLMNSTMEWGNNTKFFNPSGESDGFSTTTPDGTYNGQLGAGATYTKYKDFLDKNTYAGGPYEPASTNMEVADPVNEVECPTCDGTFRVALAFICWVNTDNTKKCPDEAGFDSSTDGATLIYHRDINQNKIYDGVSLNPRHPNSDQYSGNKNSLPGTEVFYVTKIEISSTADESYFNGTWDIVPSRVRDGNVNEDYDTAVTGSFLCNNLEVADGKVLTIRSGDYVEVLNRAQTLGTAKIVVEKGGNFVQRCDKKASEAKIEHAHETRKIAYQDYTYWSSPIQENIVDSLSNAGLSRMYYWAHGGGWTVMTNSAPDPTGIGLGRGFIAWNGDEDTVATGKTLSPTFAGTATNGIVEVNVVNEDDDANNKNNFALLGNPYACALNGEEFLLANNPNIGGAYYVWTSNTRLTDVDYAGNDSNSLNYNPADYATYNLTAGVGTAATATLEDGLGNSTAPTKYIASGQGFFVQVLANSTVTFKNFMRSTSGNTTTLFRKKKAAKKNRVWLNMSNGKGGFKQMAIGYVGGASPDYDVFYDAQVIRGSDVLIYSLLGDKKLTIQGRPYANVRFNESIPLGFKVEEEDDFEISLDKFDGEFENKTVFIEDVDTNVMHNLSESNYSFSTASGEYNERLILHFKDNEVVRDEIGGGDDLIKTNLLISSNATGIAIKNKDYKIAEVEVYNILGSKIYNKLFVPANDITLTDLKSTNQVVIVKVTYEDGYKETRKVLY